MEVWNWEYMTSNEDREGVSSGGWILEKRMRRDDYNGCTWCYVMAYKEAEGTFWGLDEWGSVWWETNGNLVCPKDCVMGLGSYSSKTGG